MIPTQDTINSNPNAKGNLMELPEITFGHLLYVVFWALLGISIIACSWSKIPPYKDVLGSTLGISLEALGVELTRGQQALVAPLCFVIFLAILIRFLPDDENALRLSIIKGRPVFFVMLLVYFLFQVLILLLAYRGWWEVLIVFPG